MTAWPHQTKGVADVLSAIAGGASRIILTSPTGMGKTRMCAMLVREWLDAGDTVIWYTNRRLLLEQTSDVLGELGLYHGIRAAGYSGDHLMRFQIASAPTEVSRVSRRRVCDLFPATRVLVDEAHIQTGPGIRKLLERHFLNGAAIVGVTATPLDLGHMYDVIVQAGNVSDGFACNALTPAIFYGPDEPDLGLLKRKPPEGTDLSEAQAREVMMRPGLFGRVLDWFRRLNPNRVPSILFAPGVAESIWFVDQFTAAGISAAHIDGECIYYGEKNADGSPALVPSTQENRAAALEGSRTGRITILCNRFVLREGIDCPWLGHAILATVFGSLSTYLQSVGRLLRYHPAYKEKIVQDHGGNWWRHGSPNTDREWSPALTSGTAYAMRADRLRKNLQDNPRRCPQCGMIVARKQCRCGYVFLSYKTPRPVITRDGKIKLLTGDIFRPRRVDPRPDGVERWVKMYHRSKKAKRTFRAAMALYCKENYGVWPDENWPFMPTREIDFYRRVCDVPTSSLR